MKKLILLLLLCPFIGAELSAQQDPQFSQFMRDKLSINPGVAGSGDAICATLIGRQQWSGLSGQPSTALLNIMGPLPSIKSGLGLTVYLDELGPQSFTTIRASYAYQLKLSGSTKLGLGLAVGMINSTLKSDWVAYDYGDNGLIGIGTGMGDAAIPQNNQTVTSFDASFGAYLSNPKYYAGLSVTHLNEADLKDMNIEISRHMYLMAGYNFDLTSQLVLTPNVLAKTDLTSTQLDINVNAMYANTFWAGVSYRLEDAIAPQVGYRYSTPNGKSVLKVGYSYDITTSNISDYSDGSHEIMLQYCFKIEKPLPKRVYKNPRFL